MSRSCPKQTRFDVSRSCYTRDHWCFLHLDSINRGRTVANYNLLTCFSAQITCFTRIISFFTGLDFQHLPNRLFWYIWEVSTRLAFSFLMPQVSKLRTRWESSLIGRGLHREEVRANERPCFGPARGRPRKSINTVRRPFPFHIFTENSAREHCLRANQILRTLKHRFRLFFTWI